MGRRNDEAARHLEQSERIEQTSANAGKKNAGEKKAWEEKAWEAVRRALGKLISHVTVHDSSPSERTIDVSVVNSEAVAPLPVPLGQAHWQPAATVHLAAVPTAGTGLRERAFLPTAELADGDYALSPSDIREMPVVRAEAGHVESDGLVWSCGLMSVPEEELRLPTQTLQVGAVPSPMLPGTKRLSQWAVKDAPVRAVRLPRLDTPRVRVGGDAVIGRMALTRQARTAASDREAITAQRRLAETAYLPLEDVALLGIYPGIPIVAVSRIVVEGEGRLLRFWVKPDVLRSRAAAPLITLLVGRQTSTGKMLQTAL